MTFADPSSVDKVLANGPHELDGKKVRHKIPLLKLISSYSACLARSQSFPITERWKEKREKCGAWEGLMEQKRSALWSLMM